jgi:CheY-like chemotaxis protein
VPTKILVADDSATMRRVLEMTFAGEDTSIVTVENGESAVAKAADFAPDVVFADISMNGVDGYEIARRIKSNPSLGKTAVIVMASQHHPYDDGKGRAAGVDDHISKPFDTQSVIDRVGQVLGRPRQSATGTAEPRAAAPAAAPAPAARPAPAPVAAAPAAPPPARGPATATRMGIGAVPVQAAPPPARPAPQAVPAAPARAPAATAPMVPAAAARPTNAPAPVAAPAAPVARPAASAAATADFAGKLQGLGLSKEQVEGVLAISREVIEQVVWEVVPDLAEQLIREEIKRLTAD